MKSLVVAMFLALTASSLFATDSYSFRLDLPDGRFALSDASGAHWTRLGYKCGPSLPDCEMQINSVGASAARSGELAKAEHGPFDLGIQRIDDGNARVRCLREECTLQVGDRLIRLGKMETTDVPAGTRIGLR